MLRMLIIMSNHVQCHTYLYVNEYRWIYTLDKYTHVYIGYVGIFSFCEYSGPWNLLLKNIVKRKPIMW